jgi:hypothetical protein
VENLKISEYSTIQEEEDSSLLKYALEEYKDLFPEILILSKKDFFSSLERYIQISLSTSSKIYPTGALNKVLHLIENKYYNEQKKKIEKKINLLQSSSYIFYNGKNFIPHCQYTKEPIHSCGVKLIILSSHYYYCLKCNLIYKPDCILFKCDKCNVEYYTEIEKENKIMDNNVSLKPATWTKYHCNALINDVMRCLKCKNILYLNMSNNLLYCIKCNTQTNQLDIQWKCILCNKSFTSEAKIYNRYEYKILLIAIKKTLFKGIEAKPKYLPCCNINGEKAKEYKYIHKNECSGILYEGELNNKKIVVCSKCHMLNYYENQYWLCPLCKVRFHIQVKNKNNNISYFSSSKNDTQNQQNYQDRETIDKKEIYQKRRKNNISIQLKKSIFNLCEQEKEKIEKENEAEKEIERNSINEIRKKKIFSARNKPKKMNFYKNYRYHKNFVNISINDHSQIIFSNYKRNNSNRNELAARFQTIQGNNNNNNTSKEKEKEKEIINTNCKSKENNIIINNIFKRNNNNKALDESARNMSNAKISKNIYPPYLLKNGLYPNPNNSEIKTNYCHFMKNKQPTMFKHIKSKTKFSYDQGAMKTSNDNTINKCNNNDDNKSKKIMNIDRVLSQKEIKEKIIEEIDILNEKSELSNIALNYIKNKIPMSKNKRKKLSFDDKPSLLNHTNANIYSNSKINDIEKKKKEKEIKILIKDINIIKNNQNYEKEKLEEKETKKDVYPVSPISISKASKESFNSDDFNIIKQIGQGSFGKIFEVEDKYHRHFAMKKIIACSLREVEIIKSEYNILYGLSNLDINLIGIYGIETKKLDRTTFSINVLMELAICDWEKEIMKRSNIKNYYTEKELILILKKLVTTFSTLQKANVSHRDIKPQNILVCSGGVLKIADFGEAKKNINKNNDNDNNTIKQTIRGTELYMSPILFNSLRNKVIYKYTKHNTYKSDVFSLGYCMLLASTLSYKLLCEIREVKNMNGIKKIIQKYATKGICIYSDNYWNAIYCMLELDEKNRPDFIELSKRIEDL